jgi:hypothetical protein
MSVIEIYRQPKKMLNVGPMEYQLVLQFAADSLPDFDRLVVLETTLIEKLGNILTLDGHDFGVGKFNIFVLTDDPDTAFTEAHKIVREEAITNDLRSAYRRSDGEDYVTLWPSSLTDFSL